MRRLTLDSMLWRRSRRSVLGALFASVLSASNPRIIQTQEEQTPDERRPKFPDLNEDPRLPDGKSQKNAIAKQKHEQDLKDADQLVTAAQDLRDDLKRAGIFVVPLGSVKKTEEIENLAKRIRGRLKS